MAVTGWDAGHAHDGGDPAERALAEITQRLGVDYPGAPPETISEVLLAQYLRTASAPVQQYRLVLAERDTRVQLRMAQRDAMSRIPFG
jgi:hypothetical protein